MNRFLFIAIFLWVANFSAMAQAYKVSGHVYLHGEPLPFASVKNAHTGEVALSDSVGCYEIEASANDSLVCEYLGCASKTMPVAGRKRLDFQLEEESTNLNGVEVVARRRPVRMSHNGFVVNMDAVRKDGKLLSDVLPQLPTLRLKDNVLSMAGKSGVLVYLNNHQVYLSDGDLMAYLNSLGLENIKRIHVISTPPAKYEAEENVGILEIETTKNIHPGWQARLLGKASVAHYLTGGASANILYSGKNFTIGNTLLGSLGNDYTRSRYTNDFGDYLVATDCPKKSTEKVVMTLTTFSLDISDRDHLSATLQLPSHLAIAMALSRAQSRPGQRHQVFLPGQHGSGLHHVFKRPRTLRQLPGERGSKLRARLQRAIRPQYHLGLHQQLREKPQGLALTYLG